MTHKNRIHSFLLLLSVGCLFVLSACGFDATESNPQIAAFDTAVALTSIARGGEQQIDILPTSEPTMTKTVVPPTAEPTQTLPPTDIPTNTPTAVPAVVETPETVEPTTEEPNAEETPEVEITVSADEEELITIIDAQTARNDVDVMLNWYAQTLQGTPFDCQDHNERYDSLEALEIVGINGSGNRTDRYANTLIGLKAAMKPLYEFCEESIENNSTAPVSGQMVSTAYKATQSTSETLIEIINEFANE